MIVEDDDVLDYMIMESIYLRVQKQDREARKEQEKRDWKNQERKRLAKEVR